MARAFETRDLAPPAPGDVRAVIGLSLHDAIARLLPDARAEDVDDLVDAYKQGYLRLRTADPDIDPLFDGIAAALDRFEAEGWLLGVATGKSMRGLVALLDAHGLRRRFITLQTADGHPGKPHPSMIEAALAESGVARGQAVMIGDTSFDIAMAANARVPGIGVSWGYHSPAELAQEGARYLAEHPSALPDMARDALETK